MAARRRTAPRTRATQDSTFPLGGLEWRSIGPYRGGRVGAVAGHPTDRNVFYFGSTGGGVWKTSDAGIYWENVSDGFFERASVGAIAVSRSDPNVVYVGMGESCIRGNVSHGDGVYKSTDGGKTWAHLGLERTRNIGKVRIDPRDPDVVYVAALGHAHGANPERGVFRSLDGGKTWKRALHRSDTAGAIDLSMDPQNPRILYAAFWEAKRTPWSLESGGPGSGIFKTTDGGDTWAELTRNPGLPKATWGRVGIAASPAKADRVWAVVDAEDGAIFRSDDGGEKWERVSEQRELRHRPWYYCHIIADPQDPETVWVLNVEAYRSTDGGKTFGLVSIPHGDNHDLWIDPEDPRRIIEGNDGGATVSLNGGESWSSIYNQPTCEFYHVTTDDQIPYRVYGAQQDNSTITVPSRSNLVAITNADAYAIGGGESGYIAVHPDDPRIVYAGSYQGFLTRYDHRTGQSRVINVWPQWTMGWPAKDAKYRFQWTYPTFLSPHDPMTLYVAGNRVFRSRDEGVTWDVVSPDLTRNDRSKLDWSGGPVTKDNVGTEYYCTIFALAESPKEEGVLWAGSDDGLVHVSRDGGKRWKNVTPRGLPAWSLVSIVEPSPHDPARAYVAANRYKLDDFHPYLFRTTDYGKTWTKITTGIGADDFTRAIREDPERPGLLFAGTETGVYVSFDDGARWRRLAGNLPVVPIHDLVIKDGDLVVATHGRSFWILDSLAAFRQEAERVARSPVHLFTPPPAMRYLPDRGYPTKPKPGKNFRNPGATQVTFRIVEHPRTKEKMSVYLDAGRNPPEGVIVDYWLREKPKGEATLAFLDARGREIKRFSSVRVEKPPAIPGVEEKKEPVVPVEPGLDRFVWNMRYPDATKVEGDPYMEAFDAALTGPTAPPGRYGVRLRAGGETHTASFEIREDPRVAASQADLEAQFALLVRVRDKLSETHEAIDRIRTATKQLAEWKARGDATAEVRRLAGAASTKLAAIEEELIQTKAKSRGDTLNYPIKLNAKLGGAGTLLASSHAAPTRAAYEVVDELTGAIDAQLRKLGEAESHELARFNAALRRLRLAPVAATPAAKRAPTRRRR